MPRKVVVIGVGGVGSHLCRGLAPLLEYQDPGSVLFLLDGDSFEDGNRERQDFTTYGFKAQVRAAELQASFPQTVIIPQPYFVVEKVEEGAERTEGGTVTVADVVSEGDIVFATVDNHAARALVFNRARELDNVDVFTGGNDEAWFGSTYHYRRRNGVDVTEHPAERHAEFVDPPDRNPGDLSCEERAKLPGGSQVLATNMAVAAVLLARVQQACFDDEEDEAAEICFDLALGRAMPHDRRNEPLTQGAMT
jgi:hypothetical protein